MIPWELVDSAPIPGNSEELRLYRRGEEFSIRVDRYELMNSRAHASEDALAELTCARLASGSHRRILIGGLGMGYTTAAALQLLGPDDRIVLAELVPTVVTWNRGPLAHLAGRPLEDARVTVQAIDVAAILKPGIQTYDAILLDVDNGPDGITQGENDWLYSQAGIERRLPNPTPRRRIGGLVLPHQPSLRRTSTPRRIPSRRSPHPRPQRPQGNPTYNLARQALVADLLANQNELDVHGKGQYQC